MKGLTLKPSLLPQGDRLVYVLLEKLPEHHDVVVQIGPARDEFPLTQVCGRLFSFNVPGKYKHLSLSLSICLSLCLSVYLCLSLSLSVSICLSLSKAAQ